MSCRCRCPLPLRLLLLLLLQLLSDMLPAQPSSQRRPPVTLTVVARNKPPVLRPVLVAVVVIAAMFAPQRCGATYSLRAVETVSASPKAAPESASGPLAQLKVIIPPLVGRRRSIAVVTGGNPPRRPPKELPTEGDRRHSVFTTLSSSPSPASWPTVGSTVTSLESLSSPAVGARDIESARSGSMQPTIGDAGQGGAQLKASRQVMTISTRSTSSSTGGTGGAGRETVGHHANGSTVGVGAAGPAAVGSTFPAFDSSAMEDAVTAVIGKPAFLPCAVTNLGDRTVSWIRRGDLNVLSVGMARYTQDPRFSVIHAAGSDLWTLQLAYPNAGDSGVYECQVGTLPKISRRVTLNVIARSAKISGGPQLYVNTGSVLNLTCVVNGDGIITQTVHTKGHTVAAATTSTSTATTTTREQRQQQQFLHQQQTHQYTPASSKSASNGNNKLASKDSNDRAAHQIRARDPGGGWAQAATSGDSNGGRNSRNKERNAFHVFWYHNGEVLNYDRSARVHRYGGSNGDSIVSTVTIAHAQEHHSGNYTCRPSNAEPDTITVHVLNGDQPTLAMQGGGSALLNSGAMSSLSLADLWRALYGVALPCMLYAVCVRLR